MGMGLDLMDLGYSLLNHAMKWRVMLIIMTMKMMVTLIMMESQALNLMVMTVMIPMQVLALQKLVMIVQETAYKMKTMMEFAMILKLKAAQMHLRVIIMI